MRGTLPNSNKVRPTHGSPGGVPLAHGRPQPARRVHLFIAAPPGAPQRQQPGAAEPRRQSFSLLLGRRAVPTVNKTGAAGALRGVSTRSETGRSAVRGVVCVTRMGDFGPQLGFVTLCTCLGATRPTPGDGSVDNRDCVWTVRERRRVLHRSPELSTGSHPRSPTGARACLPARTPAVHTIHTAYYYCCSSLLQKKKKLKTGGRRIWGQLACRPGPNGARRRSPR